MHKCKLNFARKRLRRNRVGVGVGGGGRSNVLLFSMVNTHKIVIVILKQLQLEMNRIKCLLQVIRGFSLILMWQVCDFEPE